MARYFEHNPSRLVNDAVVPAASAPIDRIGGSA
jgi:hypothetical protein